MLTKDRLLPSTSMHSEAATASAQLFAFEAEQLERLGLFQRQVCQPPKLPWALSLLSPEAGAQGWADCPRRGLTMRRRNRRI